MGREEAIGIDLDWVEPLGAAQYAQDDVVEGRLGDHEEPALEGPGGDFDEGSGFEDVAWFSHTEERTEKTVEITQTVPNSSKAGPRSAAARR
jgi:hypothetical protein